jgi:hypothetical protein
MPHSTSLPISFIDPQKSFDENKETYQLNGLIYKHFPEEGLYVLKYNKNKADLANPDIGFCRGLVLCDKTNRVVCVPPRRSIPFPAFYHSVTNSQQSPEVFFEEFVEGTNINVFYHNDTWQIATRSTVGANVSYDSEKTFREMFEECLNFSMDNLDKEYCYNFVFQHPDNRQIIPIEHKRLYLVGASKITETEVIEQNLNDLQSHLEITCSIRVDIPKTFNYDIATTPLGEVANIAKNLSYTDHGIMFKTGQFRSKVLSDKYTFVRALKGNTNSDNLLERYLIVMKNKMITQYLIYFPEVKEQFHEFTRIINNIIDGLHSNYYNCFVERSIKHNEMPFVYRPLAYTIHKHFLENKNKTTRKTVEEFIKTRDVQQLLFIIRNLEE